MKYDVSNVFITGGKKLTTTNLTQLFSSQPAEPPRKGIRLKGDPGNSGTIYVGNSNITSNTDSDNVGYPLSANEEVELYLEDLTLLHAMASSANDVISWVVE
jgi:hypothetical protein